jgi:hypothetical protein
VSACFTASLNCCFTAVLLLLYCCFTAPAIPAVEDEHAAAGVRMRVSSQLQHTSAHVSIPPHTSAYVSIRQHAAAGVRMRVSGGGRCAHARERPVCACT